MLKNSTELFEYVKDNYIEITDSRIDEGHFDIMCDGCKVVRGFQVVKKAFNTYSGEYNSYSQDFSYPYAICFRCPVCHSYKMWLVYKFDVTVTNEEGELNEVEKLYKVTSIPNEGIEDIEELPIEPPSLRQAYRDAIRSMDANAFLAAAAMFRRALQVITRSILKVKPGNLAAELKEIVGKGYNGVILTNDFQDNGYIIKEAGNQGAHPDADPDLLNFTQKDAEDLKEIFMQLVSDLFIVPEAVKKARKEFLERRKVTIKI